MWGPSLPPQSGIRYGGTPFLPSQELDMGALLSSPVRNPRGSGLSVVGLSIVTIDKHSRLYNQRICFLVSLFIY